MSSSTASWMPVLSCRCVSLCVSVCGGCACVGGWVGVGWWVGVSVSVSVSVSVCMGVRVYVSVSVSVFVRVSVYVCVSVCVHVCVALPSLSLGCHGRTAMVALTCRRLRRTTQGSQILSIGSGDAISRTLPLPTGMADPYPTWRTRRLRWIHGA